MDEFLKYNRFIRLMKKLFLLIIFLTGFLCHSKAQSSVLVDTSVKNDVVYYAVHKTSFDFDATPQSSWDVKISSKNSEKDIDTNSDLKIHDLYASRRAANRAVSLEIQDSFKTNYHRINCIMLRCLEQFEILGGKVNRNYFLYCNNNGELLGLIISVKYDSDTDISKHLLTDACKEAFYELSRIKLFQPWEDKNIYWICLTGMIRDKF